MMPHAPENERLVEPTTELEALRARWRRYRERMHLIDPESRYFSLGGLARFAPDVAVRLLILPPNPEAVRVEFNGRLWEWLKAGRTKPLRRAANGVGPTDKAKRGGGSPLREIHG